MSSRSFTTALTLYQSGTLTLDQAARRSGVPPARFVSALQSRCISVPEADRETALKADTS